MAEPVDAVAHHKAHGAGIVVRPHGFRATGALGREEGFGGFAERIIPGEMLPLPFPFAALALQGMEEALGMMDALGIAGDLLADDTQRIGILARPAHPPDGVVIEELDLERAGRRAVMRTGGKPGLDVGTDVHVCPFTRSAGICG